MNEVTTTMVLVVAEAMVVEKELKRKGRREPNKTRIKEVVIVAKVAQVSMMLCVSIARNTDIILQNVGIKKIWVRKVEIW